MRAAIRGGPAPYMDALAAASAALTLAGAKPWRGAASPPTGPGLAARKRAQARRILLRAYAQLVRYARGEGGRGGPVPADVRAEAAAQLVEDGVLTRAEIEMLPVADLVALVPVRLRGQGLLD